MDEVLAGAGAEDDDVRRGGIDLREMFGASSASKEATGQATGGSFRHHQQAEIETHGIDFDAGIVVGGDGLILLSQRGVEFHGVAIHRRRNRSVNFRQGG